MGALKGDIRQIADFKRKLAAMPRTVASSVADRAAPVLTGDALRSFTGGRTVYGDVRPRGVDGRALTLERTGATKRDLKFQAHGTIIRCKLGPRWAKYLIGKYGVLPNGNSAIPAEWTADLTKLVNETKVDT